MSAALLFPGQGSQFVGMARDVYHAQPAAREVILEANDVLGYDLSALMFEGPEDELTATANAQPAIFVASVAMLRCLDLPPDVAFAAGHSVGEYSALVAAESMAFVDGLRLVQERGRLMHQAGASTPGGMLAVLGLDQAGIEDACASVAPLVVCAANYNAPGQIIVSGEDAGLTAVELALKARGAKRVLRLNVSAAFHSPVMAAAAAHLRAAIDRVPIRVPKWPVIANVSAGLLTTEAAIRQELAEQIAAPVRWEASIRTMLAAGVSTFLEVGPGKVLTGLLKRIAPEARTLSC
ncbi:MAG TPA: ACP S-malonyltransferase [Chloroflexota bacterium]|nr:ACP S-malonyltransferase [Chloroflexota bacterium]